MQTRKRREKGWKQLQREREKEEVLQETLWMGNFFHICVDGT